MGEGDGKRCIVNLAGWCLGMFRDFLCIGHLSNLEGQRGWNVLETLVVSYSVFLNQFISLASERFIKNKSSDRKRVMRFGLKIDKLLKDFMDI
ncbi:hypothetical protein SS50377_28618 [Spironucleus salmonicida]|uniref:Uncharacterized protein n=1 Tax=Spironucleus salmonicida TaxID=348837 RepID=A0A9P8RUP5_9EUKA|nr:hypothetical protein SS50377_28618 [Spironucleus salmonicida]